MLLSNMMLDEVIVGGPGSGLFGMLLFAIVAVFIAGLMIGRTPEYLGKRNSTPNGRGPNLLPIAMAPNTTRWC